MKKLLFTLLIPVYCFGQADSAKVTVSNVVIKAKDMWFIYDNLSKNNRNEALDSTIKRIDRTNTPGQNADITINSIERRVWRDVYGFLYQFLPAFQGGVQKRVRDALILINDVWINDKIPKDETTFNVTYETVTESGKKKARKEND